MTRPLLALVVALAACASTSPTGVMRPTAPFSAELARYFDDAVDYIENPEELGGRLASDWRNQIDRLSRDSDLIVPVRIETVSEGVEASAAASYTLTAAAAGPIVKGELPRDQRISLRVSEGATGFQTVRNNITRVQSREFLLFARFHTDEEGTVRPRWHLSPNTPRLRERVRDSIGSSDPGGTETIIRQR